MKTHVSRLFAAAVVAVAVLLGSMVAADRGAAGSPRSPQSIDWQTIAGEPDAGPVGEWSSDPVGPDPNRTNETNRTNNTDAALPPAAEVPLGSFRPSPPLADTRTLAAKIEALEVRVAALESPRVITTTPQPARVYSQPLTVSSVAAAPRMVCAGGVCRVAASSPRVAPAPVRRLFRRW
jgi:hypothetical protein